MTTSGSGARRGWVIPAAFLLAWLGLLSSIPRALAQNRNAGEIRGTITDQSGAAIPSVKVTFTNTLTGVNTQVVSDATGIYDAIALKPGLYSIAFAKPGFKTFVRSGVVLRVQVITVNARLQVGSEMQRVTVTAPVPLVQTETAKQSLTLDASTVTDLPNVGRNSFNLTALMPGVAPSGNFGQAAHGQFISVNGTESFEENWLVDGGTATFPISQNPDSLSTPLDTISEINYNTHNFSAEYGNAVAVYNVSTKSGTNHWHGSLFAFDQNTALNARNFFAIGRPAQQWNEYGGTVGGPIKRDKAFFFFGYQRNPSIGHSPSFYTFPTQAMRQGDFSAAGLPTVYIPSTLTFANGKYTRQPLAGNMMTSQMIDPVAEKIQQYFPLPNLAGIVNNYYFAGRSIATTAWWNGKVDYNISPTNRLEGSVMVVPVSANSPTPTCPMNCYNATNIESTGQITDVWSITPSMVNEFRFAANRQGGVWAAPDIGQGFPEKIGLKNPAGDAFPNISVGGAVSTSIGNGVNALLFQNTFIPSDIITWIKGKHILEFGGEFDKYQADLGWEDIEAGNFNFTGIFTRNPSDPKSTGLGYADLLFGLPQTWSVNLGVETGERLWTPQLFAQDDYKIRPNLTLNVGLRYEIQPGWTEVFNRLSDFDPALTNPVTSTPGATWFAGQNGRKAVEKTVYDVFAPRLGFAWSPGSSWAVRGAYGIFDMMWGNNTYSGSPGRGWAPSGFKTSTNLLTPIFALAQGPPLPIVPTAATRTPSLFNGQGVGYTPYNTPVGYAEEWQFDVQHEIRSGVLIDAAYVGTHGVHLGFGRDINQVPPSLIHLTTTGANMQIFRPYPQYAGIGSSLFDGVSNYDAFQLRAQKHFSRGISFIANYTVSKTLDTGTGSGWGGTTAIDTWQNAYNPRANYGPSLMDASQMLNGDFVYQLPIGYGKRFLATSGGWMDAILGGWQVASIFQVYSGMPFTPVVGTANLSGSLAGSWFPNRVGNGALSNPTIKKWFNPAAFATPDAGTFGNSGRNILFGPAWKDFDFSLAKSFKLRKLGEGGQLQIRADAFDLFNVPNFGQPNRAIGTPAVGIITSANTNREIQVGAELSF